MTEQWKPVVGFEGFYEASSEGRIRGVDRWVKSGTRLQKGKALTPAKNSSNYLTVVLCRDCARITKGVHLLVAEAFLGPRPEGLVVCHGPAGRHCNRLENLSFGTYSQNAYEDKLRDGTLLRGKAHPRCQLTDEQVMDIREDQRNGTVLAAEYKVTRQHINRIKRGARRHHD